MAPKSRKRNVVVQQGETPMPALRAALRRNGMFIPPALARMGWGPPAVHERSAEEADASPAGDATGRGGPAVDEMSPGYDATARKSPSGSGFGQQPSASPGGGFGQEGSGASASGEGQKAPAGGAQSQGPPSPPPSQGGNGGQQGDLANELADEPETRQIDVAQANAIAEQLGESTTQAAHRVERLDLSEYGFLLRVVMIAEQSDPEPRQALERLGPTVGEWLRSEIGQPSRLEYDRRFRRDIEKQLSRYLTEQISEYPVIKADVQHIE